MPLISAATAAYAAGLLLGFAHATAVAVTLALAVAAASIASRRPADAATALLVLAGAMVAQATARDDARCLASLGRRQAWRVLLDGAARPGAFVRARADACHADLWLSVERGRAQAGDAAQVIGRAVRTQRGLMVQHASVRVVDGGSTLRRWREAAGRRIDGAFGADAALARALLVADTRGIPAAARDRYAAAGLSHMLSISGLHVALIALALQLAFEIARLPRRRADIATVVVIGGYVALLGAPAPALRSAVMLGLLIATRLAQRPTSPWAILALGALVPLGDPRIVLDVGWQLSTAGVAALIAASAFARRVRWLSRQRGVARTVLHGAVASTVATIVSAPLVAWSFGRLSLIGPASNLVAGPIMTIAQPMLFLSLVASPVPALARFIADAAHPLLVAFDAVASAAAAVPGASIAVAPTATTAALAGVAVIAMIVACVARFPARPAATALAAMAAMAWVPMHAPGVNRTELHVIDVGQGDAIALRTMRGHWVLLDAGRIWQGGDAGRATIVPYLAHRGGTLSAFILSHPHDDHVGGAASVIHALRPARWFDGAYTAGGDAYQRALLEARRDGVAWTRVHPGDSLTVDEATITFLAPDSAWVAAQRDANEASAVALVRVGGIRMLLTGDAERGEEEWMLARDPAALRADVLKVGHHGSTTSTTPGFLAAVSPRIALVSVGAGNVYGHPDADVLQRLAAAGVQVLRTDRLSTIVVRTDGRTLEVEAGGDRWTVAPRD